MERLRIAVTGLAATYPFGGVFWDYLQYVLGFHELGHDVLYVEDTGQWCYDPLAGTFVEKGDRNASYLAREVEKLEPELAGRWFFRDGAGDTFGRPWEDVAKFCRSADLFLHISGSCRMREEYFAADTVALLDTDPMFTQASVPDYLSGDIDEISRQRIEALRRHDVFFTFGEAVGTPGSRIPAELFHWIPTRQPLVLNRLASARVAPEMRRRTLTTVSSWESAEGGPRVAGVTYGGKGTEFRRFMELPVKSALPLELAMSGRAPLSELRECGWRMIDAYPVSRDPWVYLHYLAQSLGEWSVAKNAYVAGRTGWFSCRSACYLALGVPVVVQDTGFSDILPTGYGILPFETTDGAAEAIERLTDPTEYEKHCKAAEEIAQEWFDSRRVLTQLLEVAATADNTGCEGKR